MGFAMEALLQKPEVRKAFANKYGQNTDTDYELAQKYGTALSTLTRKKGGTVSASSRADGCCIKGKTKGKMY